MFCVHMCVSVFVCSSWSQAMEQRACVSGHQCLEKPVCVFVLFSKEHHSWECPCRIRGVGARYGGGWILERHQRSGNQILAWQ